jgi:hypothetical protein
VVANLSQNRDAIEALQVSLVDALAFIRLQKRLVAHDLVIRQMTEQDLYGISNTIHL